MVVAVVTGSGSLDWLSLFDSLSLDPSLRKRDSSFVVVGGDLADEADESSINPFARASDTLNPLMTAGNVLPSRFCSTNVLENTCFRRGFESVSFVRSTIDKDSNMTDLLAICPIRN